MKLVMSLPLVVTFVFFALSGLALATHEADHRYHIKGYVLDEKQMPLSDTGVSILMNNQVLGFGNTDADGFYRIRWCSVLATPMLTVSIAFGYIYTTRIVARSCKSKQRLARRIFV